MGKYSKIKAGSAHNLWRFYTGSSPVLTTEGANPETQKDKVGDSWKDNNIVRWQNGKCKGVGTKTLPDVLTMYLIHHTGSIPVLTTKIEYEKYISKVITYQVD